MIRMRWGRRTGEKGEGIHEGAERVSGDGKEMKRREWQGWRRQGGEVTGRMRRGKAVEGLGMDVE